MHVEVMNRKYFAKKQSRPWGRSGERPVNEMNNAERALEVSTNNPEPTGAEPNISISAFSPRQTGLGLATALLTALSIFTHNNTPIATIDTQVETHNSTFPTASPVFGTGDNDMLNRFSSMQIPNDPPVELKQPWVTPIGQKILISQPFHLPDGPYKAGHRGIDVIAAINNQVIAPTHGTVSFVGNVAGKPVLSIRVDSSTVVSFEPVESTLRESDTVRPGQIIGSVSTGGHCPGTCLHVGVRVHDNYVNPAQFFRTRPMLLPW